MKKIIFNHFIGLNRILENKILLNTIYLIILISIFTMSTIFNLFLKKKFLPFLINSYLIETFIWIFPTIIIILLSFFSYKSNIYFNPIKDVYLNLKPLIIEIVSLNWKWMIIYPNKKILTFNEMCIPIFTPIKVYLISNNIMNSLCIPKIGIQMYCMNNYIKNVNFLTLKHGLMHGVSTNFNGIGNTEMKLIIFSIIKKNFFYWIMKIYSFNYFFFLKDYNFLSKNSFLNYSKFFMIKNNKLFFSILNIKK